MVDAVGFAGRRLVLRILPGSLVCGGGRFRLLLLSLWGFGESETHEPLPLLLIVVVGSSLLE